MKTTNIRIFRLTGMLVIAALLFGSCSESDMPEIDVHEFGYENTGTASPGGDLHIDAEIVAKGTIDKIEIEIHAGDDHKKAQDGGEVSASGKFLGTGLAPGLGIELVEWEFDTVYTEFSGLKNTAFHEHIEIDAQAPLGKYHFYLTVTDMEGYQSKFEADLELIEGIEDQH